MKSIAVDKYFRTTTNTNIFVNMETITFEMQHVVSYVL